MDLVNYSYLADGSFTLGSLIYRKTGSNISLESAGRYGMHMHGGRSQSPDLKNTEGCIRISDEDIAELKVLTEELEANDPNEKKGTVTVENDLPEPVNYSDREDIKYDWERYLGELEASYVLG